jgi:hypothetical protein
MHLNILLLLLLLLLWVIATIHQTNSSNTYCWQVITSYPTSDPARPSLCSAAVTPKRPART